MDFLKNSQSFFPAHGCLTFELNRVHLFTHVVNKINIIVGIRMLKSHI